MAVELEKILVYGDLHLSSRQYGAHLNYPKETLWVLQTITNVAVQVNATYIAGSGDFSFERFKSLEYRELVEQELEKQYKLTNGNRYEIKGNHDTAGYGMTEYEYYIRKGLLKPSTNLTIGQLNFSMVDFNTHNTTDVLIDEDKYNIILMHDFLKFKNSQIADYGKAIDIDEFEKWYGVDYIIGGHIHSSEVLDGLMVKTVEGQPFGHRVVIDYLGSMPRPAYREGHMDELGHMALITVFDNGDVKYDRLDIQLLPINECFNLDLKELELAKKIEKEKRVDISDIVHQLDEHERAIGNPEDIILALNVEDKYKNKAIELLKAGQA